MDRETLRRANMLREDIDRIGYFLRVVKNNRTVKLFKKTKFVATVSDYMRTPEIFEFSEDERLILIDMLQKEYERKVKEFEDLGVGEIKR